MAYHLFNHSLVTSDASHVLVTPTARVMCARSDEKLFLVVRMRTEKHISTRFFFSRLCNQFVQELSAEACIM
jgi:hypothetical protein